MRTPRRTPFLVALLLPVAAFAACADDSSSDDESTASAPTTVAEGGDETTTTATAMGKGKGSFVVGDRTFDFEASRCLAEEGDPVDRVEAAGKGTFDGRPFTVTVKSSPSDTSAIETIQVVFAATEAVVGTNYVVLPAGAADVRFEVADEGKASGTIAVTGTGGQPSGEGTLSLACDPA